MKKYFITGLLTLLPVAITFFILIFLIDFLTKPFVGLIESLLLKFELLNFTQNHTLLLWTSRIIALISLFFGITLLGFLVRKFFFSYVVDITHRLFERIPLIRTIFKSTKQITEVVLSQKEKFFKKSVLIKFPHEKSYAMGLQTGRAPKEVMEKLGAVEPEKWHSIFIPTAPHPISGFVLIASEEQWHELDLSVEDVFKFLVSCGTFRPGEHV